MNPSDLLNRPQASTSTPQANQFQPYASTSSLQPNGLANGVSANGNGQQAVAMDLDDPGKPKSRKEQEQDKKDLELGELLEMMDEWKPIIPDEVTDYYLQRSGFETSDVRVKRLLALAAQRFVSSISADAYQYARTRTAAGPGGRTKEGGPTRAKDRTRTVLTMEDLSSALKEYGVGADRAAYYL